MEVVRLGRAAPQLRLPPGPEARLNFEQSESLRR
jgi:hypothetical protein